MLDRYQVRDGLTKTSIIAQTFALVACGSEDGGGNGDTNSNGFTPPSVSGLGPGADNQQDGQDFAVAATLDGNNSIAIPDAHWIGASSSGQGTADVTLDAQELGEVFLLRNDTELAAVNAADPAAGMVKLGTLPSGAVDATLFGLAPGPHRLLQVEIDGEPTTYEVIYVNTDQKDSLVTVSAQAHENGQLMRPVQGS